MNAPRVSPPLPVALAIPLAILATFAPTSAARARLSVVMLAGQDIVPVLFARLAPGLLLAFVPGAVDRHTIAAAITAAGYAVATPPAPQTWRHLAEAMIPRPPRGQLDPAALATYLDSLPASVRHVRLSPESTRALDAAHLRAIVSALVGIDASQPLAHTRRVYRDGEANAAGILLAGDGWRALFDAPPVADLDGAAPPFDPAHPVALACASCGTVAPLRHATEHDAQMEALRRRWTPRETDEGDVYDCRPCATKTTTKTTTKGTAR